MLKRPFNRLLFESPAVLAGLEPELTRRDFEFERRLGDGAFGQVWRVKHKSTLKIYAMKQVPKDKVMKMLGQFRREVYIMYELSHPHIIKLFNHFEDEKFFYLIMELAEGGNLFHKLYREKCFLERNAAQYFREVVLAVEYLHSHVPAIIHRDIKPENILLDKEGRIKLTDFGWSNYYSTENPTLRFTMCGTLEYLPPEIASETGHNTGADIWCLGILLFEMLTGSTPFASKGRDQMLTNITQSKPKFPHSMAPLARDLIGKMIEKDPQKRISATEIKCHAWLLDHPPIRETITQDCIPKLLPSIEEINKVLQAIEKKDPGHSKILKSPEKISETIKTSDTSTKNLVKSSDLLSFDQINDFDQSTNEDNSKKELVKTHHNDFRTSVVKLKQQVELKSEDNSKIKGSIQDLLTKLLDSTAKSKVLEEKIQDKKKELNAVNRIEKELLSKLADCNIELERNNHINIVQITEKINQKNSDLLAKSTLSKQLRTKYENLKSTSQKILQEFLEKEKILSNQNLALKRMKEKLSQSNVGKKSEITELTTNAEVLKSRLGGHVSHTTKLGRQETSTANEIMRLIKDESINLGTNLRPKLEKQYNQLQERVAEKEQELAEAKISFEESRSAIMQMARVRKDEIIRTSKRKNESLKAGQMSELDEKRIELKKTLQKARQEENKYYMDGLEIHKTNEKIKGLQKQLLEFIDKMKEIRKERNQYLEIISNNKEEIEKIEMDIGLLKVQIIPVE
ncbi:hypothetical protein SteCoe_2710 [Stentor coeruleus]|uniref:Aurora kinase n=1 Tax=Stentor coeruleus TaxID=5963 RepID=A0A1R2CYZ2_9CILI|nr:hypothetical protein SteCoe_2710 [Stentor coeruleus]